VDRGLEGIKVAVDWTVNGVVRERSAWSEQDCTVDLGVPWSAMNYIHSSLLGVEWSVSSWTVVWTVYCGLDTGLWKKICDIPEVSHIMSCSTQNQD